MQVLLFFMIIAILYHDVVGETGESTVELASSDAKLNEKGGNLEPLDDPFVDIYKYTLNLLMVGMRSWLDGAEQDLKKIERYLGFPDKTVNLIDDAMTELHGQQRMIQQLSPSEGRPKWKSVLWNKRSEQLLKDCQQRLNKLSDVYYFSCDVKEYVSDGGAKDVAMVRIKFEGFLKEHGPTIVVNMTVDQMEEALESSLAKLTVKMGPAFRITVGVMKNKMCFEPSTSKIAKMATLIKDMKAEKTVFQLAQQYSKCATGTEVLRNHLTVLRDLVPRMFRYAYDHVNLSLQLYGFGSDENGTTDTEVLSFSTFVDRFTLMFVDRYFEFRGDQPVNREDLINSLITMSEFCDPDKPLGENVPNIFNFETFRSTNQTAEYTHYVKTMLSESLKRLVELFEFDKNVENLIKRKNYTFTTKEECMDTIKANVDKGLGVMDVYSEYFPKPSVD